MKTFKTTTRRRLFALILCAVLVMQQSFCLQVLASNITDGNGVAIGKNAQSGNYEIRPDAFNGTTGFKTFQDLNLSQGEILNFLYQWYQQGQWTDANNVVHEYKTGDIDTFVNFVSSQININGIVNSLTSMGGALKGNGNLVFISPNGMVVGASGVLNVGSLSVLTPTQDSFNAMKNGIPVAGRNDQGFSMGEEISKDWNPAEAVLGNGTIRIDGKIIARGNVDLQGGTIAMADGGGIIAGLGNNNQKFVSVNAAYPEQAAEAVEAANALFNALVNVDHMDTGSGFANANGNIVIKSNVGTSIDAGAMVRNFASNSNTTIENTGVNGINIGGEVSNPNGNLSITNSNGALKITSTGVLKNKGQMTILNNGTGTGLEMNGTATNIGTLNITNNTGANGLKIGGSAYNTGTTNITNKAGALAISGLVDNNGTLNVTNQGNGGMSISGTSKNINGNSTYINEAGLFSIDGTVSNVGTKLTMINKTNGTGITQNSTGKIVNNGILEVTNDSGLNGLALNGTVTNTNGTSTFTNQKGELLVGGTVTTSGGKSTYTNTGTGLKVASTGRINNTGALEMYNNGLDGLNIAGIVTNQGNSVITNEGNGALTIAGLVDNNGTLIVSNKGVGGMTVSGTSKNINGNSTYANEAGEFLVSGTVSNNGAKLTMTNTGTGLKVSGTGKVENIGELEMTNTGANGLTIIGNVKNQGAALIKNSGAGALTVSGTVDNTGNATLTNSGTKGLLVSGNVKNNGNLALDNSADGLSITGTVENITGTLTAKNTGTGGMKIDGTSSNNGTGSTYTNEAGAFTVNGTVSNVGTKLTMTNKTNGTGLAVTSTGKVINNGILEMTNESGTNGLNIAGTVTNTNGASTFTNQKGELLVGGTVTTSGGKSTYTNTGTGLKVTGQINNTGALEMNNSGVDGLNILGTITNNTGAANIVNSANAINLKSAGRINSNGTSLTMTNTGANGINLEGLITQTNNGTVTVNSTNSNIVIGDNTANNNYITSNGKVAINLDNGNLYNSGVAKTLIKTTENADLVINVANGAVGKDFGAGIGPNVRDFTKSVNTSIDGTITAISSGTGSLINMASLNKDMNVNQIKADGKVILIADDSVNKGATAYNVINKSRDDSKANVEGKGISIIASGNIGSTEKALTFLQTAGQFNDASWNSDKFNYSPNAQYGVDMLAIKDINVKGLDNADGTKSDTNVNAMISRTGNINAEFSGDTYIKEITAANKIDIVNRGKNIYIENLGLVPTYLATGDYYGPHGSIVPNRVTVKSLDLGTVANPNNSADSTIIIKNGQIAGEGKGRPSADQDLILTADNAYAGGYYFDMGKNRMPGHSTVTKDNRTNTLTNPDGETVVSIRGTAVRPKDVEAIGRDPIERNYYYGADQGDGNDNGTGSEQGKDPNYDGKTPDGEDDDNLVVPVEEDDGPPPPPGDDDDDDGPPPTGDDDDDDDGPPPTGDDDDDDDGPPPTGDDDDDDDGPPPTPGDDDDDVPPPPIEQGINSGKGLYKERVVEENLQTIDKRQYMRFNTENNQNAVAFESTSEVESITNISRGGVQMAHKKKLKVGDIVPVNLKYGDVEIVANVEIMTATDVTAGGKFIDLDEATANKVLYLSLKIQEQPVAKVITNLTASSGIDE